VPSLNAGTRRCSSLLRPTKLFVYPSVAPSRAAAWKGEAEAEQILLGIEGPALISHGNRVKERRTRSPSVCETAPISWRIDVIALSRAFP